MSDREPPLARDLSGVKATYTWKYGERKVGAEAEASLRDPAPSEAAQLHVQISLLRDALEDVVALALSGADYKERAIMMHRRAVAALSGVPVHRAGGGGAAESG